MTLKEFQAVCSFVREQNKKEYMLFMNRETLFREFNFLDDLESYLVKSKYFDNECIGTITYNGVTFFIIDPSKL